MRNISTMNRSYTEQFGNANTLIGPYSGNSLQIHHRGVLYSKATRLQDWSGVEQMTAHNEKRGIPWKSYCSIRSNMKTRFEMPDKKYPNP
jgi:hypothetical protein